MRDAEIPGLIDALTERYRWPPVDAGDRRLLVEAVEGHDRVYISEMAADCYRRLAVFGPRHLASALNPPHFNTDPLAYRKIPPAYIEAGGRGIARARAALRPEPE